MLQKILKEKEEILEDGYSYSAAVVVVSLSVRRDIARDYTQALSLSSSAFFPARAEISYKPTSRTPEETPKPFVHTTFARPLALVAVNPPQAV